MATTPSTRCSPASRAPGKPRPRPEPRRVGNAADVQPSRRPALVEKNGGVPQDGGKERRRTARRWRRTAAYRKTTDSAPGVSPRLLAKRTPPLPGALSAVYIDRACHQGRSQTPLVSVGGLAAPPHRGKRRAAESVATRAPEADRPLAPRSLPIITTALFPAPIGKAPYLRAPRATRRCLGWQGAQRAASCARVRASSGSSARARRNHCVAAAWSPKLLSSSRPIW